MQAASAFDPSAPSAAVKSPLRRGPRSGAAYTGGTHTGGLRRSARLETVRGHIRSRPGARPDLRRRSQDQGGDPGDTCDRADSHGPGLASKGAAADAGARLVFRIGRTRPGRLLRWNFFSDTTPCQKNSDSHLCKFFFQLELRGKIVEKTKVSQNYAKGFP